MAGSYFSEDTIVAIATSLAGDAGVGIIRLSGPAALNAARSISSGLEAPKPRYLHRIDVCDERGEVLDDGLAVYFEHGNSFTGETVVELQLHGGRFLLQTVLRRILSTGQARLALPGEFSFRAVRNGRLTLSGAQALGQLVSAKSLSEVQIARKSLARKRLEQIDEIGRRIRNLLAQSELSIDFIDQDVEVISKDGLEAELKSLIESLEILQRQTDAAIRIAHGLTLAIIGAPNAGKSTLFNAILSEERAIVSPEAGTTRDVVTEEFLLGPYRVRLADTAGVREISNQIEKEGIGRALSLGERADAAMILIDASRADKEVLEQLYSGLRIRADAMICLNKQDLLSGQERVEKQALVEGRLKELGHNNKVVFLSGAQHMGVDAVLTGVKNIFDQKVGLGLESFLPTEFQTQMMVQCRQALAETLTLVCDRGMSNPELISVSLSQAAKALSDLVGDTTPDSILSQIFSEFCIGK